MSPQKARLVADMVRGKKVNHALNILRFTHKATARVIEKLIKSARSNAEIKNVADPEEMKIRTIYVDGGPVMKRQLPRARGKADIIRKPFSHVTVVLEEEKKAVKKAAKKAEQTKAEKTAKKAGGTAKKTASKKSVKKTAKAAPAKKKTAAKKAKAAPAEKKKTSAKSAKAKGKDS